MRFTTVELSEIETRILNAGNLALEIEKRLYQRLSDEILDTGRPLNQAAARLAELDLTTAFARRSGAWAKTGAARRSTTSAPSTFRAAAIPVVEHALRQQSGDCLHRQ